MHTLTRNRYALYKIAQDAGYTPRELSLEYNKGTYTLEVEQLIPNAIFECYTGREDAEKILLALSALHALGVQPAFIDQNSIYFRDGAVVFLTVDYSKAYSEEFEPEEYAGLISALTSTTHAKNIACNSDEASIYQEMAEIGAAPEVIGVAQLEGGRCSMVTRRYPYSLNDAAKNGVYLSEGAKRALAARMRAMHLLGVLHCDVTEENFVCNLAGEEAYVIDFGLSVRLHTASLDVLREYIQGCKDGEEVDVSGDRVELVMLATQLELEKLIRLLKHF